MSKIFFSLKKKQNFNHKNKLSKTTKISIFLVFLFCVVLVILSFFIDVKYQSAPSIIDFNKMNIYKSKWVLEPLGYMIAGFGLPLISCALQITTRNKLAEPTTLGFYPVILLGLMVSKLTLDTLWVQFMLCISFSLCIVFLNLILTKKDLNKNVFKSVLLGFCINGIFTGINWIISTYCDLKGLNALDWMIGTPSITITTDKLIVCGIITLICSLILFVLIPYFNVIQKDSILAKSLGINVELIYWIVAILSILIVCCSMFIAGGIMLIGLVIPHLCRIIFKTNDNNVIMPLSCCLGMFLLVYSNMLRNYAYVNINLLTAVLAIPVFFVILKKKFNTNESS